MRKLALAAALTLTCAAVPASAATGGKCVTFPDLSEHVTITTVVHGDPTTRVGEYGKSHSDFYDTSGRLVGTEEGEFVVYASADGKPFELFQYTSKIAGGTTFGGANISILNVISGGTTSMTAVGTGGWLRGKVGTRDFVFVGRPAPDQTRFTTTIKLCG
ncbi:hypothetical protein GCM10022419_054490 [Nonomuraea rosea]|jgi:hypothetical protein|uniref:Allene oxide cyclase barrel-like domain-containing protein n=1 Tax=Nonomuraea rosea TaxID=638574 RepID=A0ABP6XGN3_9ACTN